MPINQQPKREAELVGTAYKYRLSDGSYSLTDVTYDAPKCGCRIVGGGVLPAPLKIEYCPTHGAAPKLLEACKRAEKRIDAEGRSADEDLSFLLYAAIAKAEGRG